MRRSLLLLLFLSVGILLYAQEPICFGDHEVYLETNVGTRVRGRHRTSSLELGIPTGERLNVLVQFGAGKISHELLKQRGVELGDYLGANAYYATIRPGSRPNDFLGTGLRSVSPLLPEWKIPTGLLQNNPPEWAQVNGLVEMSLVWFPSVDWSSVQRILDANAVVYKAPSDLLRSVKVQATADVLVKLAAQECVAMLAWTEPPQELENNIGARLSGARVLRIPATRYGRELTGKGVRIGVWDGNVGDHVDYGKRVHCLEFESSIQASGAHGMHVTGTIGGRGLLDVRAKGMAYDAEIWTSNFNKSSNNKNEATEMYEAFVNQHISLTSNSYGAQMKSLCRNQNLLTYTQFGKPEIDYLAYITPELTHVFAAGNNQGQCNLIYSSSTKYSKNIIAVGAVDSKGHSTTFSSYGPLKDGRMYPTISALGEKVYSTVNEQHYAYMDGTSMACPTVTGHLALLTQRFQQLNGGALPYNYLLKALVANTATDAGRPGPDYQYGYGILNAVAAAEAIEHHWYTLDELTDGQTKDLRIQVPAGVKELRVMLCWNDPVARKNYAVGECPLVNDLDLTVSSGTNTVFPWTLAPMMPELNASQDKKNDCDPLEQVSITHPVAGEYVVHVSGSVKQENKQTYALVWYFDAKRPELTSPVADEIYAPSEDVYLKTDNLSGLLRVELSYDNGNSYKVLGQYNNCTSFTIPSDAPVTQQALIRVTDEKGVLLQMSAPFTIMAQVKNVKLNDQSCSKDGWELSWDAVANAVSYDVLRVNLETEAYEEIATVTTPHYALPNTVVKDERNIFAVRAVSNNGVKGERSIGVLATKSHALALTKADLPYTEHFIGWPMKYATTAAGENLKLQTMEAYASLQFPLGANMLMWQATVREPNWNAPFDKKNNCGSVEVCQLDLSKIEAGTKLHFVVYALMLATNVKNGSMLRLLVDDNEYADVLNRNQIQGDDGEHTYAWDLSKYAGQKIKLKIEVALQDRKNALLLVYYRISEGNEQKDVFTYGLSQIPSKENMREETVRFKVKNNSAITVTQVPVSLCVDDKVVYTQTLVDMKPFEDREFKWSHDFMSEEAHKFKVTVKADVQDDQNPRNNEKQIEVYNLGNVIRMPKVKIEKLLGILDVPVVPYEKVEVKGVRTFVDNGGLLEGYSANDEGVLQLLPSSPEKTLQITFKNYDLGAADELEVYTDNIGDDLKAGLSGKEPTAKLTGKSGESTIFLSEADNGGLTFHFISMNKLLGEGWEAEVREVTMTNRWKFVSLETIAGKDVNHKKIVATVKNLASIPFQQVPISATMGLKTLKYTIPVLAANTDTRYTFPDEIDVTAPFAMLVDASLPKDGDVSDNVAHLKVENDPLWHSGIVKTPSTLYIMQITPLGETPIYCPTTTAISYQTAKKLTLYKESKNAFELKLSKAPATSQLPAKVRVWINLDDNNELSDALPEYYTVDLVERKDTYWLEIDLSQIADLKLGTHRMRFMLANDDNYTKYKQGETIEWGQVFEFTAEIKEGASPLNNDIAVLTLEGATSGTDLSATTEVKVRLRNEGLMPAGKVKLQYKLDDGAPVIQEFTEAIESHGGEAVVTFTQKADLSAIGRHVFEIELIGDDANAENNKLRRSVYHIAPATNSLYTIAFNGTKEEYMSFSDIKNDFGKSITIEGWWKLDAPQFSHLVIAPSIWVASVSGTSSLPDNTLLVEVGKNLQLYSIKPVLKPGQWQHIAVAVTTETNVIYSRTFVKVYVDGELIEMKQQGRDTFDLSYLLMSRKVKGETSMLRFWNTERIQDDIRANRFKSVRKSTGELEEHCVAEFLFTEGKGNASASDSKHFLALMSNRSSTELWQPLRLIRNVTVEGQVLPAKYVEKNLLEVMLASTVTDFTQVKLSIVPDWEGTQIMQDGTPHSETRVYDFSASTHTLEFVATRNDLFGKNVEQRVKVRLVNDLSAACDILHLALNKADNAKLKHDVDLSNVAQNIVLNVENANEATPIDPKEMYLTFKELSPSSKLFDGETEVLLNTPYKVDLTTPHIFRVLAENQRDEKFYTVQLAMGQTINWATSKLTYVFAKEPVALDATATSHLPVTYASENPSVVSITPDGKLQTTGVGSTYIVAMQNGQVPYSAAPTIKREVEVTPAALTIRVKEANMEVGKSLPEWEFEYEGLLYPNTQSLFDTDYEVLTKDGKVWNASMPPLAVGDYEVRAKDYTAPYNMGYYTITRLPGLLHVKESTTAHTLTLTVKNETDAPMEGVDLLIGKLTAKTNAQGQYALTLQAGKYQVVAKKDGYTVAKEQVEIKEADLTVNLKLAALNCTITYTAGPNGIIQGETQQKVAKGHDGEPVIAVPLTQQYRFKKWSDESKEALRQERNVSGDMNLMAEFEEITHTLTYHVSEGGESEVGSILLQTVVHGANGTAVKVKAKEGYLFKGWSDGVKTAERTDSNITSNLEVTALFVKPYLLTWSENFDFGNETFKDWDCDPSKKAMQWKLCSKSDVPNLPNATGFVAMVDTRAQLALYRGSLYSPWLSLEGRPTEASVVITFLRYQKKGKWSKQILEYAFEDDNWHDAIALGTLMGFDEKFELSKEKLVGHSRLRFRWTFDSSGMDEFLAIDDVLVKYEPAATAQEMLTYIAGEHGFVREVGTTTSSQKLILKTTNGTPAPEVEAVPENETQYEFAGWSDGKMTARRSDAQFVTVMARFQPKQKTVYELTYVAQLGSGTIVGNVLQVVNEGEDGTEVIAKPNLGYHFVKWNDGVMTAKRTELNVQASKTYTAEFAQDVVTTYTLTYVASEGGTIIGTATQTVNAGEKGTEVEAKANAGYHFVKWDDGVMTAKRTEMNVQASKTYTAEFAQDVVTTYTLTYVASEGGTIIGTATQTVNAGEKGTEVEAKANAGYHFVKWDDGVMTAKRIEMNVQASKTYTAEFAQDVVTYTVTLATEGRGTLAVTGYDAEALKKVPAGTELTVVAKPDPTWMLKSLMAGTVDIKTKGKFTVNADVEVKAVFEKKTPVSDAAFADIVIAPNPFENRLRITHAELRGTYVLMNAQGVVVRSGNIDGVETILETSDLTSGLYLLYLTTEDGATKTYSVVKQ